MTSFGFCSHGDVCVVDVRLTPWSRRPDFSKKRLCSALEAAGIAYEHMGGLGNPPMIRDIYLAGNAEAGHTRFREHLNNGGSEAVDDLVRVVDKHRWRSSASSTTPVAATVRWWLRSPPNVWSTVGAFVTSSPTTRYARCGEGSWRTVGRSTPRAYGATTSDLGRLRLEQSLDSQTDSADTVLAHLPRVERATRSSARGRPQPLSGGLPLHTFATRRAIACAGTTRPRNRPSTTLCGRLDGQDNHVAKSGRAITSGDRRVACWPERPLGRSAMHR